MKVLFVTNLPSPYRVEFFNQLSNFCELTVVYERHSASDRDKKWVSDTNGQYKIVYLKGVTYGEDKSLGFGLIKYLKKSQFDQIVFCGFSSPTIIIGIVYCCIHHIKYFIESDGGFDNSAQDGCFKRKIKHYLTSNCEGILTTSDTDKKSFIALDFDENRIKKYPFSSITQADVLDCCKTDSEKEVIKKQLGLNGDKIVIFVGQFIHRKGLDILLQSAQFISPDTTFYIIGGVPDDKHIDLCKNNQNIIFKEFMGKEELLKYYIAADLFVLPTREDIWGLVVNEAMACGLPVVTTDRCGAGLEMIKDGVNGYIVPSEDVSALSEAINTCLCDKERLKCLSKNALITAKDYTIENMVKYHIDYFSCRVEI